MTAQRKAYLKEYQKQYREDGFASSVDRRWYAKNGAKKREARREYYKRRKLLEQSAKDLQNE